MTRIGKSHDYQFLPINCPKCNVEGKVKIGRLDRSFQCKHCKKTFHVDPDGVILGERPPEVDDETDHMYSAPMRPPKPGLIERIWTKLPGAGQMALLGAILLGGVAWFIHWMLTPPVVLPESVEDRAMLVAQSLLSRDYGTVKKMFTPDTSWDGGTWSKRIAGKLGGELVDSQIDVLYRERGEGVEKTGVVVVVALKQSGLMKSVPIITHWVRGADLQWMIDAKRSLAEAPAE